MKSRYVFLLLPILTILVGCGSETNVSKLSTEEVLKNAAKASQTLSSAEYDIALKFSTDVDDMSFSGDGTINGVLQESGKQVQFRFISDGNGRSMNQDFSFNADLEILVASLNEVFLKLHTLDIVPQDLLVPQQIIDQMKDQWWSLPQSEDQTESIAPDPRVLNMQASIVSVTKDGGITKYEGRDAYYYEVEIDKDKLIEYLKTTSDGQEVNVAEIRTMLDFTSLKGRLWIDAENFLMHRIIWNADKTDKVVGIGTFSIVIDAKISEHNSAKKITPPADAKPFAPPVPDRPQQIPAEFLDSKTEDEILDQLLNDSINFPTIQE